MTSCTSCSISSSTAQRAWLPSRRCTLDTTGPAAAAAKRPASLSLARWPRRPASCSVKAQGTQPQQQTAPPALLQTPPALQPPAPAPEQRVPTPTARSMHTWPGSGCMHAGACPVGQQPQHCPPMQKASTSATQSMRVTMATLASMAQKDRPRTTAASVRGRAQSCKGGRRSAVFLGRRQATDQRQHAAEVHPPPPSLGRCNGGRRAAHARTPAR